MLAFSAVDAPAQSTTGKDFWTGFMYNFFNGSTPVRLSLYVSAHTDVTGVVSVPGIGWQQPFTVSANTGIVIDLPSEQVIAMLSEAPERKAVHVVTSDTVDLFAMNHASKSIDATPVFATGALGTDYRAVCYEASFTSSIMPSQLLVVPTGNGTEIEITPSRPTLGGHIAFVPFTVTLDSGEVYQVQSDRDLTGTRVRSTNGRPFALLSGNASAAIPIGYLYVDHVEEQLYPVDRWGTDFLAIPLATRMGDTYRIVAASDGTDVRVDGENPVTLNAGEFSEMRLTGVRRIHASRPVAVAQFSNSATFDMVSEADPFMLMLSPNELRRRDLIFNAFSIPDINRQFVNIAIATVGVTRITLDGVPIGGSFQQLPSDPNYSYATIEISRGSHRLASPIGFIAYAYGFGEVEAYGYSTGSVDIPCITPSIAVEGRTAFCQGDSVVLDAGAGFLSYLWSTGDTSRRIVVREAGTYSVTTTDSGGCVQSSAQVTTTVDPLPSGEIVASGSLALCPCDSVVLTAPEAARYRWSSGDTTRSIVTHRAGTFVVAASNSDNCVVIPPAVTVTERRNGVVEVMAGIDSAAPGERVVIPIHLRAGSGLEDCRSREFITTVRFNGTLLQVVGVSGGTVLRDEVWFNERRLTVRGLRSGDTLLRLECLALLGNAESTPVVIDSLRWESCDQIPTDTSGGRFTLTTICRDREGARLVDRGATALKGVTPQPSSTSSTLAYTLAESGPVRLYLIDGSGRRVATLTDEMMEPGEYSVTVDVAPLGAGLYWYVLETPRDRLARVMHVMR